MATYDVWDINLVQAMACRLFGTMPLPDSMRGYFALVTWKETPIKFNRNTDILFKSAFEISSARYQQLYSCFKILYNKGKHSTLHSDVNSSIIHHCNAAFPSSVPFIQRLLWLYIFRNFCAGTVNVLWPNQAIPNASVRMMTSSNGTVFRVTGPLCGELTGPGEFPAQRPVTQSFDVFFYLRLNKRLSKQPWGWWFERPPWSLWRHRNGNKLFRANLANIFQINWTFNDNVKLRYILARTRYCRNNLAINSFLFLQSLFWHIGNDCVCFVKIIPHEWLAIHVVNTRKFLSRDAFIHW